MALFLILEAKPGHQLHVHPCQSFAASSQPENFLVPVVQDCDFHKKAVPSPSAHGRSITKSKSLDLVQGHEAIPTHADLADDKAGDQDQLLPFPEYQENDTLEVTIHRLRSESPPPALSTIRERKQSIKIERREIIKLLRRRTASRAAELGIPVEGLTDLQRDRKTGEWNFVADRPGRRRMSLGGHNPAAMEDTIKAGMDDQMGEHKHECGSSAHIQKRRRVTCMASLNSEL